MAMWVARPVCKMDDEKNKGAFLKWLLADKTERHSRMIDRSQGEKIIQFLRDKRDLGEDDPYMRSNYESTFRKSVRKRDFKLITVVGLGDILCLPINKAVKNSTESHAMLGQNRQVIFKEDMYDVIQNAHTQGTKHLGYKGTFKKLNETYCCIPRTVVWKFVGLCDFCAVHHACFAHKHQQDSKQEKEIMENTKKPKKKFEFSDAFLTRCQIDILDMIKNPDGAFSYIGHFFDHHTKFSILFPLKTRDAVYVARKLCRHVFGHCGLPRILYSNMPRDYIDELIRWILQFWATDLPIINGDPGNTKASQFIQQRQRTIAVLIDTFRMKDVNSNEWATWLPCIQYSLNTNEFEKDMPPSYDAVFKARSRCYNYSVSNYEIPREETLMESDEVRDSQNQEPVVVSQESNEASSPITSPTDNGSPTLKCSLPHGIIPLDAVPKEVLPRVELIDDA